ncbi:hypothetical protein EV182_005134 [Spiromyces aspiralis]|uniref:Uncharacterized protein n=1 Tax=Spiromyces aspiralis TaxID=68401 RepID=A0ACC1HRS2_9FUNG|nr:hypothetical protein EV182_005134 [Spiromyces aspiralis]
MARSRIIITAPPPDLSGSFLPRMRPFMLACLLAAVLLCLSVGVSGSHINYPEDNVGQKCNGHYLLCSRDYNDITYIGTRSSFAVTTPDNSTVPGTQYKDIGSQLDDGIRLLNLNLFPDPAGTSAIHLCFPDCSIIDAGPLDNTLEVISRWMDNNPDEVVTIMLFNDGGVSAAALKQAVVGAGLDSMIFGYDGTVNIENKQWPTLSSMISSGRRLVIFGDQGEIISNSATQSWVFAKNTVLKYMDPPTMGDDPIWKCNPYGMQGSQSTTYLPHFFTQTATINGKEYTNLPQPYDLANMNTGKLLRHFQQCRGASVIWTNFVLIDFYDQGDLWTISLYLNGLPVPGESYKDYYPDFKAYGIGAASTVKAPRLAGLSAFVSAFAFLIALDSITAAVGLNVS